MEIIRKIRKEHKEDKEKEKRITEFSVMPEKQ